MGSVKRDKEVASAYGGGAVCGNEGRWVCARWHKDTGATHGCVGDDRAMHGSTRDSEATRGSIGDFGVACGDARDFRATRGNAGDGRAMWGNTEVLELCVARWRGRTNSGCRKRGSKTGNHRVSLKDGVILKGGGNGRGRVEGEVGLVEDDVMGDNDSVGGKVEAPYPL